MKRSHEFNRYFIVEIIDCIIVVIIFSSSKAAGRMRRRGTESMMTLHPYAPVPGTQLGWSVLSYARVLARVLARANLCRELTAVRH